MLWLAVFGLIHYYFIWYGDILFSYAVIGMIAWLFRASEMPKLLHWAFWLLVAQLIMGGLMTLSFFEMSAAAAAPGATAEVIGQWTAMKAEFAVPGAQRLAEDLTLYRGDYAGIVGDRLTNGAIFPFFGLFLFVINALMFWAAAGVLEGLVVRNFLAALVGSLLYTALGVVIDSALERLFSKK